MSLIEQTSPVLDTKLRVPRLRPSVVRRPRLTTRLDEAARGRLVLVSAPAGFGKTTVLSEWMATAGGGADAGVAWLSLDAADSDLMRFLFYLVTAVGTVAPQVSEELVAGLRSPQPPAAEVVLTDLINAVARSPRDVVVVLDDFHAVDSAQVDQAVAFLVERGPAQLHVVIAGREDPRLPLARWRAGGVLSEVRAEELRFTTAETATFLSSVMGLDLRGEEVGALAERTEGWIAGLQLAALSLQRGADPAEAVRRFTGSHRYVFDYLVDEVLAHRSQDERLFLLQTSILEKLDGDLCDAVTGQRDGGQVLERLDRGNVFVVALDDQRRWYRYHHLFADVLRARLNAEFPDQVEGLHRRASDWFDAAQMPVEAIGHALSAGDLDRAAELLERAGEAVDRSSRAGTWLSQARVLPDGLIRARPALAVWYAYALLGTGDLEAAASYLADAEGLMAGPGSDPPPDGGPFPSDGDRALLGRIAVARAYLAASLGDSAGAVVQARQALALLPSGDAARRDQATALLGMACLAEGDLQEADRVFTGYSQRLLAAGSVSDAITAMCLVVDIRPILGHLRSAEDAVAAMASAESELPTSPCPEAADLYRAWAELDLARGDLVAASEHLYRSSELGQLRVMPVWAYRWHVAKARLRLAHGDPRGALDLLEEAQRLYIRTPMPDLRPVPAMRARIWAGHGRVADALAWARERWLSVDDGLDLVGEYEHLTLARIMLADLGAGGSATAGEAAVGLLERLLRAAEDAGRVGSAIEILAQLALAHHAMGHSEEAAAVLERALALAAPEGFLQVLLDEGPAMADLLREVEARGTAADHAGQVLAAFPVAGAGLDGAPALTSREVEVLGHVAAGLSNQQIAALLCVSPYTVKAHARSIYDKLDAHSRTAAVARARALRILPPA